MGFLAHFRWMVVVLVLIIGCAAILFSRVVDATDQVLERVMGYDIAWSGSQGRHEAAKLARNALALAVPNADPAAHDELRLSHDIFRNRMNIWSAGDFRLFLDRDELAAARFAELTDRLADFGAYLEEDPWNPGRLAAQAETIKKLADRLGTHAYTASIKVISEIREELRAKQAIQSHLIVSLFALGLALVGLTTAQNRSLRFANQRTRESAARFEHLARHDPLTGLANRIGFNFGLEKAAEGQRAQNETVAVLALDLDGFKAINDSLGHAAGDAVLKSVGSRLSDRVLTWDQRNIVSRFGGDEFVIVLFLPSEDRAAPAARQLRDLLRVPCEVNGALVSVDATIGLAVSSGTEVDIARLPIDADLALTRAKADGKGTVLEFAAPMREAFARQLDLERELEAALREGEVKPHYQPLVDLASGRVVGLEALARWHHPRWGWISPAEFIPLAEGSGKIAQLGRTILAAACEQALSLPDWITMSVNLSVAQLKRRNTVDDIIELLRTNGLPPERLKLEVTESMIMSDGERGFAALRRLKDAGIRIALDDFGTGYSALSYLHQFPWDQIKIDRSFIGTIGEDERSLAIVRSVISLAKQMGIEVVAEGIEEPRQRLLLLGESCDIGQGYLFSRPVPAEELAGVVLRCFLTGPDGVGEMTRQASVG